MRRSNELEFPPAPSNFTAGDLRRRKERVAHYAALVHTHQMSGGHAIAVVRLGDASISTVRHLNRLGLTRSEIRQVLWNLFALLFEGPRSLLDAIQAADVKARRTRLPLVARAVSLWSR